MARETQLPPPPPPLNRFDLVLSWETAGAVGTAASLLMRSVHGGGAGTTTSLNLSTSAASGAAAPGTVQVHRGRRCNRYTSDAVTFQGAFHAFSVSPPVVRGTGAGWLVPPDGEAYRWIWDAAFPDLAGGGANARAGLSVSYTSGGASILNNGAGMGYIVTGGGVRFVARPESSVAQSIDVAVVLADAADWHTYEIRIYPATFAAPARLLAIVDSAVVHATDWGATLLPTPGAPQTATAFHAQMSNLSNPVTASFLVADYRLVVGPDV